jgi:hypothetical protein
MKRRVLLSFLVSAAVFAGEKPLVERVGPDGEKGQARVVTPDNALLTPLGRQVELPGMRPQAAALSPDGKLLVVSGKASVLVVSRGWCFPLMGRGFIYPT